ncbi:PadR family transcriptional regulator [Tatumella citrea]|uniref:PadR family transcriptional regulator n=1 Tax=Tatumella citrea TaxID=53336 RepID=A0A1Y0L6T1_TATCI|nr:helix-turn-helix transcriptional regulator [Tatumella citrea]ARU93754.1 PadR family transcriptional regulator [Tatumella citrea]ARU97792.1 PadR family transcriptional regulator [Tatumella citrea]
MRSSPDDNLKSHVEMVILAALERGPCHGYSLIELIRQLSGGVLSFQEGTVYPLLHRMEMKGSIQSEWEIPTTGRKRKVYQLTPAGSQQLTRQRNAWSHYSSAVSTLLQRT